MKEGVKNMEEREVRELKAFAVQIRMAAIEAIHSIGSGHIGGALSPGSRTGTSWCAPRATPAPPCTAPWL